MPGRLLPFRTKRVAKAVEKKPPAAPMAAVTSLHQASADKEEKGWSRRRPGELPWAELVDAALAARASYHGHFKHVQKDHGRHPAGGTLAALPIPSDYHHTRCGQKLLPAESSNGHLIVAFRGTLDGRDIMADLEFTQEEVPLEIGQASSPAADACRSAAHQGFWRRAEGIPLDFFLELLRSGRRVIFTGHSMGGAVASMVALRLLDSLEQETAPCSTSSDVSRCESSQGQITSTSKSNSHVDPVLDCCESRRVQGKGLETEGARGGTAGWSKEQLGCITFGMPLFANVHLAERINGSYRDLFHNVVSTRDPVPRLLSVFSAMRDSSCHAQDLAAGAHFILCFFIGALQFVTCLPLEQSVKMASFFVPRLVKVRFLLATARAMCRTKSKSLTRHNSAPALLTQQVTRPKKKPLWRGGSWPGAKKQKGGQVADPECSSAELMDRGAEVEGMLAAAESADELVQMLERQAGATSSGADSAEPAATSARAPLPPPFAAAGWMWLLDSEGQWMRHVSTEEILQGVQPERGGKRMRFAFHRIRTYIDTLFLLPSTATTPTSVLRPTPPEAGVELVAEGDELMIDTDQARERLDGSEGGSEQAMEGEGPLEDLTAAEVISRDWNFIEGNESCSAGVGVERELSLRELYCGSRDSPCGEEEQGIEVVVGKEREWVAVFEEAIRRALPLLFLLFIVVLTFNTLLLDSRVYELLLIRP